MPRVAQVPLLNRSTPPKMICPNRLEFQASVGDHQAALDRAELGLAIAEQAAIAVHVIACALIAPITLAQVLLAVPGSDPRRSESVLAQALAQVEAAGAHAFEPGIRRELAALALLRGDAAAS